MAIYSQMFNGFYFQPENYIPNNMHKKPPILPNSFQLDNSGLHKLYSKNKLFKGYWWNYGDTVSIPLTVNTDISVESTALIYDQPGAEPLLNQAGYQGQRLYNIVDLTSWTMIQAVPIDGGTNYLWKKDATFTYPTYGELSLKLIPDMRDKTIVAQILNFRREEEFKFEFYAVNDCTIEITPDISKKLLQGIYYLRVTIQSENNTKEVDYYELNIKQRI